METQQKNFRLIIWDIYLNKNSYLDYDWTCCQGNHVIRIGVTDENLKILAVLFASAGRREMSFVLIGVMIKHSLSFHALSNEHKT